jgi:hypothetical protein
MDFVPQAKRLAQNGNIVIAFLSDSYYPLFDLWYRLFRKHNLDNYLIFALDERCFKRLKMNGINAFQLDLDKAQFSKGNLWVLRIEVLRELVRSGLHVIHTDVDAFWLRNAVDAFGIQDQSSHLIISRDAGVPKEAKELWGFTMCCGLYLLRSNSVTVRFVDDYLARVREVRDDQRALNYMLLEGKVLWSPNEMDGDSTYLKTHEMTIDVLSYEIATRGGVRPNAYVYHPWLPPKNVHGKVMMALDELGERYPAIKRDLGRARARLFLSPGYWFMQAKDIVKRRLHDRT